MDVIRKALRYLLCTLAAMLLGTTMKAGKRYSDSLRWDWQKGLIRKRDGYQCRECGNRAVYGQRHLEVHHRRRIADGGSHSPFNLALLCKPCHDSRHAKIKG